MRIRLNPMKPSLTSVLIIALLTSLASKVHAQLNVQSDNFVQSGDFPDYRFTEYYEPDKMDPQKSGWPIIAEEQAYILKTETDRYPGTTWNATLKKFTGIRYDMVPQTPNTQGWGNATTTYLMAHQKTIQPILDLVSLNEAVRNNSPITNGLDIIMVGDSITSQWGGGERGNWTATWTKNFGSYKAINMGIGGDRTSSVLWRLDHTPFEYLLANNSTTGVERIARQPKVCVLQIGHNNQHITSNTTGNVQGVVMCLKNLRFRFPKTPIIWLNIFPAAASSVDMVKYLQGLHDALNAAGITDPANTQGNYVSNVHPLDLWSKYARADGVTAFDKYFYDGIHPSPEGYQLWADNLKPMIEDVIAPRVIYDGTDKTGGSVPTDTNSPYAPAGNVTVLGPGNLTKTNHTFAGWNTAADGSGTSYSQNSTFTINITTTLYAQWNSNAPCTLTYNGTDKTGGTEPPSSAYTAGTTVLVLGNTGNLTKTGSYTFAGWNTKADGSGTSYSANNTFTIRTPTTLYAQWTYTNQICLVTYNGTDNTGGSLPDANVTNVTDVFYKAGDTVTVLGNTGHLSRTNYTFAGWNTAADGSGTSYSAGNSTFRISSSTTLYAKWTYNGSCTLTYNGTGSTGGTAPTDAKSYPVGAIVTVLGNGSLSKSGNYTFSGWNTKADGSGTSYSPNNTFNIAAPLTLYAQWSSTAIHTWTRTAGKAQSWGNATNWSGGIAPSPSLGDTMDFSTVDIAAATTLTLGADRKATLWKFGDTSGTQTWTVDNSNKIILVGTTPTISVLQNSVSVNCQITGSASLTKAGPGNLTLSSLNKYTGGTFIKEGSISLGKGSNRIPTNSVLTLGDTSTKGTLILGSGGTPRNQMLGGLSSTGLGGNVIGQGEGSTLTLNMSGNSTFSGVLGGTGSNHNNLALIKQGDGTLTLSGNNSYTGTTWLNGGTLAVDGSLANTTVTVANGAALAGSGYIGGNVTIQNGAHQAFVVATTPIAHATRTINGTLTLDAGHVIDLTSTTASAAGNYTLVTASGGVSGTVGTINLTGLNGTVSIVGKSLVLTITAANDYDGWKSANGLIGEPNDDDDQDGMTNFGEYAFGLNPNSPSSFNAVSAPIDSTNGHFKYTRRKPSLSTLTYIHEYSTTLASGSWSPFTPDSATVNGGDPVEEVTIYLPPALLTNPKLFLRARATK